MDSDIRAMCGRRVVTVIWLGNFSYLSRSTDNCQYLAEARMLADFLLVHLGFSPALTKSILYLEGRDLSALSTPALIA